MNLRIHRIHLPLIVLLTMINIGIPNGGVDAQGTSPVKVSDQVCWTKDACIEARTEMGVPETALEGGFYGPNTETLQTCGTQLNANDEEIGFCLPSYTANTNISFGGRTEFTHLGDFIEYMYRYGIMIAAGLSVIVIIIAGLQWTLSGGSPERIKSAQSRIIGALTGLFLAATSYIILQTINPAFVRFRLPRIWMINNQGLTEPFCKDTAKPVSISAASPGAITNTELAKQESAATMYLNTDAHKQATQCGLQYYVDGTGGQMCTGIFCNQGETCAPSKGETGAQSCQTGDIILSLTLSSLTQSLLQQISGTGIVFNVTEQEWLDDDVFNGIVICQGALEHAAKEGGFLEGDDVTQGLIMPSSEEIGLYQGKEIALSNIEPNPLNTKTAPYSYFFRLKMNGVPTPQTHCDGIGGTTIESQNGVHTLSVPTYTLKNPGTPVGVLVQAELTKEWSMVDPNIVFGKVQNSTQGVTGWIGTGNTVQGHHFIPLNTGYGGTFVQINVGGTGVSEVFNKKTSPMTAGFLSYSKNCSESDPNYQDIYTCPFTVNFISQ